MSFASNKCKKCNGLCDGSLCIRCRYFEYATTSHMTIDKEKCIKCRAKLKRRERHICDKCCNHIEYYVNNHKPKHQFMPDEKSKNDDGIDAFDIILLNAIIHNHTIDGHHDYCDCDGCECNCSGCDCNCDSDCDD